MNLATHNYSVTLVSPRTGDHRTFRVRTVIKGSLKDKRVVELLINRDGHAPYLPFAFINEDGSVNVWSRLWRTEKGIFAKYGDMLMRREHWEAKGVKYLAEGRCIKCNRRLTNPKSIESGIGSECAHKMIGKFAESIAPTGDSE